MRDKIQTAVKALDSKKGIDIRILKIDELTTIADYFILCGGSSTTQVKALADECEFKLKEAGYEVRHREGREADQLPGRRGHRRRLHPRHRGHQGRVL